jgi:CRP/FNR family transcriptional regulator
MSLSRLTNHVPAPVSAAARETVIETPFLADSYAEDWERLERYGARRRFRAGEAIVRQGEVSRSLIIVLSGELAFVRTNSTGEERLLGIIPAPTLVGEVGFFDPGPRSGTLRALGDGELLQLSFAQFEALAASSPSLARTILLDAGRIVAMRLRRSTAAAADSKR